jgi:TonB family protein
MRGILAIAVFLFTFTAGAALAQKNVPAAPPYRVGGEVTRPEKVSGDPPEYTEAARRARVTGVVIIEAVIDEQGNATEPRVLKSLPLGLDRQALDAVQTWKFKPATLRGKPVPVYYTLVVTFQVGTDLSFGPRFGDLLQKHPDFAGHVQAKRYEEAAALLDRWAAERPKDPEIRLGRSYVLMAQGRMDEAWEEVQAYDGPDPGELFSFFARNAENQPSGLDSTARYELVEMGLQAVDRALAARPDDIDAVATKRDLLQDKAMLMSGGDGDVGDEGDEGEEGEMSEEDTQALLDEAARLQRRVDELQDEKGELTFPKQISGEPAELTEMARKAGISGTVTLEAEIDEQGNVVDARIIRGLPMGLDEKALEAVRTWKFKPATIGGKPLKVNYTVTVSFR